MSMFGDEGDYMTFRQRPGADDSSSRQRPGSDRSLHGPLQGFDLEAEVSRLREEKEWQEGRRNAITLRKGEGLSIVLLVMKAGDRLDEHFAPGPISLSVQEGRIRFTVMDEVVEAGTETMLACDARVHHSVEALNDAVCLLHVAAGDTAHGSR
jgi:quercetin dioxygenase-like cupin family protein